MSKAARRPSSVCPKDRKQGCGWLEMKGKATERSASATDMLDGVFQGQICGVDVWHRGCEAGQMCERIDQRGK